ncbi:hypothetical protein LAZ67_7002216 [Cordylochernes scorpioides]|uniref:Mos1 transposase HTH domain-containing protein n=1 Tax=Cordylochernes scorpioides TaxID=51811 RepID=A0ABY6KMX9_9ARAC|nr:hypothetical protein LAZ67_7002216 [Cordylochernes scorpioides]
MEAPLKNCTTLEQRAVIRFLNAEGIQTSQICQRMRNIYGESCLSQKTFINELTSSKMDELHVPILSDLDDQVWIPHFLNLDQKLNRIRVSKALLKRYEEEGDHFLDQIVTGYESCCYHYDPSTKRASMEWKRGDSPRPKKIRSQRSAGKVLITIFWDVDGPICLDFLSTRQRMNGDLYCDILVNKLKPVLEHPAYSPDLASSDYFLFGLLKKELKGKRFDSDEDVQKVVQDFFHTLPKSAYKEGIYKLPERWRRCIESQETIELTRKILRAMIFYYYKSNLTSKEYHERLMKVSEDKAPSIRTFNKFIFGKTNLEYVPRSGRPPTSVTQEKIELQQEKCVGIGSAAINNIINDQLKYRKLVSRWVPHSLTEDQKLVEKKCYEGKSKAFKKILLQLTKLGFKFLIQKQNGNLLFGALQNYLLLRMFAELEVLENKWSLVFFFRKRGFIDIVKLEDRNTVNSDWYTTKLILSVFEKSSKADQELNLEEPFFTMTMQDRTPHPKH